MSFHSLEHELIKSFKTVYGLEKKDYVLSCSGGLDSIALFHLLRNIQPVFNYDFKVVHFHHGASKDYKEQSEYRDEALAFVEKLCLNFSIEFFSFKSSKFLKTEEECRAFRHEVYESYRKENKRIFLAHHKDDLFETLLIRLLRGTGVEGIKSPFSKPFERPLLEICGRKELFDYVSENSFDYIQDPSNKESDFLRNWLRNEWLSELEKKAYGLEPFKNSLIKISEHVSHAEPAYESFLFFEQNNKGYFNLFEYMTLNQVQKKAFISKALHKLKKTGYTAGQVLEVLKHLELNNQQAEFNISGVKWKKTEAKVLFEKG